MMILGEDRNLTCRRSVSPLFYKGEMHFLRKISPVNFFHLFSPYPTTLADSNPKETAAQSPAIPAIINLFMFFFLFLPRNSVQGCPWGFGLGNGKFTFPLNRRAIPRPRLAFHPSSIAFRDGLGAWHPRHPRHSAKT